MASKLLPGDHVERLTLETIHGAAVTIPCPDARLTHLQFRRFAGCPICNLHLRSFIKNLPQIERAGIREVVFFHSTTEQMLPYQGDMPFHVIADPDKKFYAKFGVEQSLAAILNPSAWIAYFRGLFAAHPSGSFAGDDKGHLGLPADILLDATGKVVASKYGHHADDQWTIAELLDKWGQDHPIESHRENVDGAIGSTR